jgi:hypothetical protein
MKAENENLIVDYETEGMYLTDFRLQKVYENGLKSVKNKWYN